MEIHNRDVFPTKETQSIYGPLAAIVLNPIVDKPFHAHEEAAKRAKLNFHRFGRTGMLLVLASTVFTVAERLVIPPFPGIELVIIIFIVLGIAGLAVQIYLLVTKKKQLWLGHRFAAERLRSIKFQAYQLAVIAHSPADLAEKANAFYSVQVTRLQNELNGGYSALVNFWPGRGLAEDWVAETKPRNHAIGALAQAAYRDLRILYQRTFAEDEVLKLQQEQRIGYTSADILYLLGAALALAALTSNLLFPAARAVSSWIDFLAITSFVGGLVKTIMDNASLAETSKVRYEDYVRALGECEQEIKVDGADFSTIVRRIERVVLGELSDFCQSAGQISYRL